MHVWVCVCVFFIFDSVLYYLMTILSKLYSALNWNKIGAFFISSSYSSFYVSYSLLSICFVVILIFVRADNFCLFVCKCPRHNLFSSQYVNSCCTAVLLCNWVLYRFLVAFLVADHLRYKSTYD